MKRKFSAIIGIFSLLCLFGSLCEAQEQIAAANTSQYLGTGQWEWTIFIRASPGVLSKIRCVEYKMHPSFPKPSERQVCEVGRQDQPFALSAVGWGTFEIPVRILFNNGTVQSFKHALTFTSPSVNQFRSITARNTAKQEGKGRWNWTVYLDASTAVLDQIRCVQYTLHPTFPNPVREVCERGDPSQPFALSASGWGKFVMRIRVFFRDGQSQEFQYELRL
jgi:transcription initiation factor IIF auxiliary subunit